MVIIYFIGIFLLSFEIYMLYIVPSRRKKEMVNCEIIKGKIIDCRQKKIKGRHRRVTTYSPVYGFDFNGAYHTIYSKVSSNCKKHREIGREVDIIINKKTGEIYCSLDEEIKRRGYLEIGIFALIILIVVIPFNLLFL